MALSELDIVTMKTIQHCKPESVYALSKMTGRRPDTVLKHVRRLERKGLVSTEIFYNGKRRLVRPTCGR